MALPKNLIPLVGLFAALSSSALGQDRWPEHRGPNGNYHLTTDIEYPKKWSVATDENIRWRMPLPETGHSGIAVWENRLFLTCFRKLTDADIGPKGTWVSTKLFFGDVGHLTPAGHELLATAIEDYLRERETD